MILVLKRCCNGWICRIIKFPNAGGTPATPDAGKMPALPTPATPDAGEDACAPYACGS